MPPSPIVEQKEGQGGYMV